MNVIHALGWYLPDSIGGTEVYVAGLCKHLQRQGIDVTVAAARSGTHETREKVEDVAVYRYPVHAENDSARTTGQIDGSEPHGGFDRFEQWLGDQSADIYHQHSLTYGCSVHHLQAAKARGMKTVLTVHTPGILCLRGTLLLHGTSVCDGRIEQSRCARCWLQSRGSSPGLATLLAAMPPTIGAALRPLGRAGTALASTSIVDRHLVALRKATELADRVVAVCQWLYDALLLNGIDRDKLVLSRQGIAHEYAVAPRVRAAGASLTIGFLGRGDPVKGVGVLLAAWRELPRTLAVRLRLCVVESDESAARHYMQQALELVKGDDRVALLPALQPAQVPEFLDGIDILAVPSQWLETGPLVVLEALAAGVPVLGSALGGISELVSHRGTGLLVKHDDVAAWASALQELATDPVLVSQLAANIGPVRTMADAARDMQLLYSGLVTQ